MVRIHLTSETTSNQNYTSLNTFSTTDRLPMETVISKENSLLETLRSKNSSSLETANSQAPPSPETLSNNDRSPLESILISESLSGSEAGIRSDREANQTGSESDKVGVGRQQAL